MAVPDLNEVGQTPAQAPWKRVVHLLLVSGAASLALAWFWTVEFISLDVALASANARHGIPSTVASYAGVVGMILGIPLSFVVLPLVYIIVFQYKKHANPINIAPSKLRKRVFWLAICAGAANLIVLFTVDIYYVSDQFSIFCFIIPLIVSWPVYSVMMDGAIVTSKPNIPSRVIGLSRP